MIAIDLDSRALPESAVIHRLLSEVTAVYLVNVRPAGAGELRPREQATWKRTYEDSLTEAYERVIPSLHLAPKVFKQLVTLTGSPAKEILSFASYVRADLIVVGQRRRWMLQRRFGGGLPSRILRGTSCSVLVLPRSRPDSQSDAAAHPAGAFRTETVDRRQWASSLMELSHHNCGRKALLELDDIAFGAQAQASDFPFLAVEYDRSEDQVELMLGEQGAGRAHVTHVIRRPTSIDILERADGRTMVLRVANERGQTLLSFNEV